MLNNLIPVEWSNQRVLTTAQLAEVYECNPKNIKVNFGNAKEQFVEGVHYFELKGEALSQFKRQVKRIDLPISTFASHLYLWTYQGCVRHCKMLNTSKAWEMFDELEQVYFKVKVAELPAQVEPAEPAQPIETASVYSLLLSNTLVKVGFSRNVKKRKRDFKGVKRTYASPPVAVDTARDIERLVKEKFFANRVEGELFNITFEEAVTEIKRHFPTDDAADYERLRLLVDLCAVAPEPLKEQLVRQTANLILGKRLF